MNIQKEMLLEKKKINRFLKILKEKLEQSKSWVANLEAIPKIITVPCSTFSNTNETYNMKVVDRFKITIDIKVK